MSLEKKELKLAEKTVGSLLTASVEAWALKAGGKGTAFRPVKVRRDTYAVQQTIATRQWPSQQACRKNVSGTAQNRGLGFD
jgi:hypothetical protein